MINDTMETTFFGTYVEQKDTSLPASEFIGTVKVFSYDSTSKAAYLFTKDKRYDLPAFMQKYDGQTLAVLGRHYTKQIGNKIFDKIIVIAVKQLRVTRDEVKH